ncbi:MAG: HEAT repeat domain-containing protein [candidate division WOR-3 bacterium]|nr:MAG: HEAT repeat domain-containing protein [candidate division WOR-3 bacterium]
MSKANSNVNIDEYRFPTIPKHSIPIVFLIFVFGLFSYVNSSYISDPWKVVKEADIIVEGRFESHIDTTMLGIFKITHMYKGKTDTDKIVVYLYNQEYYRITPIQVSERMLLILKSRKAADLNVRKLYDSYESIDAPLYIPAQQPAAVFSILDIANDLRRWDIEKYLWINEVLQCDSSERYDKLFSSINSPNGIIQSYAMRALSEDINNEIQRLTSFEEKAERYVTLLDTTNIVNLELFALRFFTENYYPAVYPVLLRRFENMPDSVLHVIRYYIETFEKYLDSTTVLILFHRIVDWDYIYYAWFDYPYRQNRLGLLGYAEKVAQMLNSHLPQKRHEIYSQLNREFSSRSQDSLFTDLIFPYMDKIYASYVTPHRTEFLTEMYERTRESRILPLMAKGGELSALPYLTNALYDSAYSVEAVLSALGSYTDKEVGSLLVDFIENTDNKSLKNSAIDVLTKVLSNTQQTPSPKTIGFVMGMLKSWESWDMRAGGVNQLLNLVSASKSDTMAVLLIANITKSTNSEKKKALIHKLDVKNSDKIFDFLLSVMINNSETLSVRKAALWQLARDREPRICKAIYDIAASKGDDISLRIEAIGLLLDRQKELSLAVIPLIDVMETLTTWKEYKDLWSWTGYMSYISDDDLNNESRNEFDYCLRKFYVEYLINEPVTTRFEFIRTFRTRTDWKLYETYSTATQDPDKYIKEEAQYALEEISRENR